MVYHLVLKCSPGKEGYMGVMLVWNSVCIFILIPCVLADGGVPLTMIRENGNVRACVCIIFFLEEVKPRFIYLENWLSYSVIQHVNLQTARCLLLCRDSLCLSPFKLFFQTEKCQHNSNMHKLQWE